MKKFSILLIMALIFTLALAVTPVSACGDCCECCECEAATPGYWKNHPDDWPVESLQIGETVYTKEQILYWLDQPVKNDKTITMFKALVAAKLSIKSCPDVDECKDWIMPWIYRGDYFMNQNPVGSGLKANSCWWQSLHGEETYLVLDAFNNGLLCAESRD